VRRAAAAAAVRYFSEQLAGELGEDPSVQTIANLVATVSGTVGSCVRVRENAAVCLSVHPGTSSV
jgi:hypothetical protein